MKQKSFSLQDGFTLLEGILALSLLMGLLALGVRHLQQKLEKQLQQGVAEHHCLVAKAAEQYVFDNYGGLGQDKEREEWQKQHAEKNQETLSLEQWRYQQLRKRYLPKYLHEKNSYQQPYAIYITAKLGTDQPQPHYQLLVTTYGGLSIKEPSLRQISRKLGNLGGYISHIEKDEHQEICITGNQKQWQMSRPSMTFYQPPQKKWTSNQSDTSADHYETPGHLVSLNLLYDRDIIRSDNLLHRKKIADNPQANTMETDLQMCQNQLICDNNTHTGTMNAQKMELICRLNGSEIAATTRVQINHESNEPEIKLTKQQQGLSITSNHINFLKQAIPEEWSGVVDYSPAELHTYWNKIPYYELYKTNDTVEKSLQLAGKICQREADKDNILQPVGRMFMIGVRNSPEYAVYLCIDVALVNDNSSINTNFAVIYASSKLLSDSYFTKLTNKMISLVPDYLIPDFLKKKIDHDCQEK